MPSSPKVFHSRVETLRANIHLVLVRPQLGRNVGAIARALANMGIHGILSLVGSPSILDQDSRNVAKHAGGRLEKIRFFVSLKAALASCRVGKSLALASTARSGSPHRPHPLVVREAAERAVHKLQTSEIDSMILVFGPEGDGLTNAEVDQCDWVVTIPSHPEYRSLNLSQAVMVFAHEINTELSKAASASPLDRPGQKQRLIQHLMQLAEEVGFLLPGDPFKMRPRLEEIFSHLPNHIREVRTVHGLIDQIIRSVRAGGADYKGRFRAFAPPGQTGVAKKESKLSTSSSP